MGLELPAELTQPLSWIGMEWPQADEELLFAAGQHWLSFGMTLQAAAERANGAAEAVGRYNTGDTVDAFQAWWQRETARSRGCWRTRSPRSSSAPC